MMLLGIALGGLGLVSLLCRRSLMGALIGIYLSTLGSTVLLVWVGASSGHLVQGVVFGLFVLFCGIAQVAVGCTLALRLFYLRQDIEIDTLKRLKH